MQAVSRGRWGGRVKQCKERKSLGTAREDLVGGWKPSDSGKSGFKAADGSCKVWQLGGLSLTERSQIQPRQFDEMVLPFINSWPAWVSSSASNTFHSHLLTVILLDLRDETYKTHLSDHMLKIWFNTINVRHIVFEVNKPGIHPLLFDSSIDVSMSVEQKRKDRMWERQHREKATESETDKRTRIEQREDAPKQQHTSSQSPSSRPTGSAGGLCALKGASLTPQPCMSPQSPTLSYIAHSVRPTSWPI